MKGRPTLYKGIRMRSRLEADYAAWLDRQGRQWEYEPECFADEHGQWLPDFRVAKLNEYYGVPHLIEVKPGEMLRPKKGEQLNDVLDRVDAVLGRCRPAWVCEPGSVTEVTFWRYGVPEPDLSLVAAWDKPWTAWVPGFHLPLLWIGAGQGDTVGLMAEVIGDVIIRPPVATGRGVHAR